MRQLLRAIVSLCWTAPRSRRALLPHVADAADSPEVRGKVIAKLGTHTSHVHVDGARTAKVIETPDAREQGITRVDMPRMRHQKRKQRVLEIGEVDGAAIDEHLVGREEPMS